MISLIIRSTEGKITYYEATWTVVSSARTFLNFYTEPEIFLPSYLAKFNCEVAEFPLAEAGFFILDFLHQHFIDTINDYNFLEFSHCELFFRIHGLLPLNDLADVFRQGLIKKVLFLEKKKPLLFNSRDFTQISNLVQENGDYWLNAIISLPLVVKKYDFNSPGEIILCRNFLHSIGYEFNQKSSITWDNLLIKKSLIPETIHP